ncbi:MAG: leucyl aminopeptidase [Thaumarchaeota archaeon]|nr:MAG: leucyl aminopeptidase [Nitrososphaerota archaeon]TLX91627.1 MAG: leucyl aminopeptidase [Nitrososphaerota archaeon]
MVVIEVENNVSSLKTQLLVDCVFTDEVSSLSLSGITLDFDPLIREIIASKEFNAKSGSICLIHNNAGSNIKRALLLGLGDKKNFNPEKMRNLIGKVVNKSKELGINEFALIPFKNMDQDHLSATVEGIKLSDYSFNNYKTDEDKTDLNQVRILIKNDLEKNQNIIHDSTIVSDAVIFCRNLSNLPPNDCSPKDLANFSVKLSNNQKVKVRIIENGEMESYGLGGILAVGKGSSSSPKLIIIEYSGSTKNEKPIVIVGKAVTFDTGGISIKPSEKMDEMKFDKCGGCNVLGIMKAVSGLNLDNNVIGIIPSVENMPSGSSYRPGDIIKMYNRKTVEVLNTDAEGRIILADALAFAVKTFQPKAIIDMATLTGAAIIALGTNVAAMMGNDKELVTKIIEYSNQTGEKIWELPLYDEYKEQLKSSNADMKNIGGRSAGAITAGAFLSNFVDETPWVHLDIAGTAWNQEGTQEKTYNPKGATGFGIRTIVKYIRNNNLKK